MSLNKRKPEADTTVPGSAKKRQQTPTKMIIDLTGSSTPPSQSPTFPAAYTDGLRTSALVTTPASQTPHAPIHEYKVIRTFTQDERVEETVVGVFTSVEMANKAGRRALEEKGSFSENDVQFDEDGLFYVEETPLKDLSGCCYGRIEIIKRTKRAKKTKKATQIGQV